MLVLELRIPRILVVSGGCDSKLPTQLIASEGAFVSSNRSNV